MGAFAALIAAIRTLQFGGTFTWQKEPNVVNVGCADPVNTVAFASNVWRNFANLKPCGRGLRLIPVNDPLQAHAHALPFHSKRNCRAVRVFLLFVSHSCIGIILLGLVL